MGCGEAGRRLGSPVSAEWEREMEHQREQGIPSVQGKKSQDFQNHVWSSTVSHSPAHGEAHSVTCGMQNTYVQCFCTAPLGEESRLHPLSRAELRILHSGWC
jgi:hypothetical protein